jgi:Ca2+-binding RTX toxin-like protein
MAPRKALIGAAVAALTLALPPSAGARIWLHADKGPRLDVNAQLPHEDDEVSVSAQGQGPSSAYVFENPASISQATAPCIIITTTRGSCPAEGRQALFLNLGKGTNTLHLDLGQATGEGFDLRRFSFVGDLGRDLVDLSGAALPSTVGQARATGNAGADRLIAGAARLDLQDGGRGNDRLIGSPGRDSQFGSSGRDRLSGGAGSDELRGGTGKDVLRGGPGFDLLKGGPGFDRVVGPVTAAEAARASSIEQM